MGLIRQTLSLGTGGVVQGKSKKQRTAAALLKAVEDQNALLRGEKPKQKTAAELIARDGVRALPELLRRLEK